MAQINPNTAWLRALAVADGTPVEPDANGWVTLAAASYVFALNIKDQPLESINIQTDSAIAFVATIEDTNAPRDVPKGSAAAPGTVSDWVAAVSWVTEDPTDAYVASVGTGWTIDQLELTKTAGVGAAMIHLGNFGAARVRLLVVVSTPGTMRVAPHGKS